MTKADSIHLDDLKPEYKDMAIEENIASAATVVVCIMLTAMFLYGRVETVNLVVWTCVMTALSSARLALAIRLRSSATSEVLVFVFRSFIVMQGIVWGGSLFFLGGDNSVVFISVMTIILVGACVSAMFIHVNTPNNWLCISVPIIMLDTVYMFQHGSELWALLALSVFFVCGLGGVSLRLNTRLQLNKKYQLDLQEKHLEIIDKNQKLFRLAHYDGLTGASNRKLLRLQATKYIEESIGGDFTCAFFLLDLDNFKHLNDTMGHAAGDELLRSVTARLRACLRTGDVISRLGGDEFGIFIKDIITQDKLDEIARKVISALAEPHTLSCGEVNSRASMGIAVYPDHGVTITEMIHYADLALQDAKKSGKGTFKYCSNILKENAKDELAIETDLIRALAQNAIKLHYQPIVSARDNRIIGAEALMRIELQPPIKATPRELIFAAQSAGRIDDLSRMLFASLEEDGPILFEMLPALEKISINLSPIELRSLAPVKLIEDIFSRGALTPNQLQVEITEQSVLERGADRARHAIDQLANMGVAIAMDDFGTGYSSLTHLKTLPVETVKIDKSFVDEVVKDARDAAIVKSIIGMCKGLGLTVTAEGVEDFAQFEALRRLGCDKIQGYLFFRPESLQTLGQNFAGPAASAVDAGLTIIRDTDEIYNSLPGVDDEETEPLKLPSASHRDRADFNEDTPSVDTFSDSDLFSFEQSDWSQGTGERSNQDEGDQDQSDQERADQQRNGWGGMAGAT